MSSSERATATRMPVDPVALEARVSVAALFDVLERSGAGPVPVRAPGRRPSNYRPAGARRGAVRTVPLRSVRPAPMARPVPGAARVAESPAPVAPVSHGRLASLIRRAALWGAGPQGEYLAWRPAVRVAAPAVRTPDAAASRRGARLGLLRRAALWGAGAQGEHLAWGGPARPAAPSPTRPVTDRPVVLRELPSTPTIQLPAPSPAPELSHRRPAPAGSRWTPPVPRGAVAVPGIRPSGPPERSRATGWPPQPARPGVPPGLVRARGDPLPSPARGSPGPAPPRDGREAPRPTEPHMCDHGSQPLDAVLRSPPSTPRPVTPFPG